MGSLRNARCECVKWVLRYMRDCVCGFTDYLSLGFGLVGCVSWAVSEVPQIFTNFKCQSTEGVSLAFLMTWVVGDVFNLVGCVLEPSTLPTQLYTAVVRQSNQFLQLWNPANGELACSKKIVNVDGQLYTTTTLVLVWQTIYYDYCSRKGQEAVASSGQEWRQSQSEDEPLEPSTNQDIKTRQSSSSPIPTISSPKKNLYFRSSRSPASTHSPTWWRSSLGTYSNKSSRNSPGYLLGQSYLDEELMNSDDDRQLSPKKATLPAVAVTIFVLSGLNNSFWYPDSAISSGRIVGFSRRKLLQDLNSGGLEEGSFSGRLGTILGWIMAVIYMGGRLPQIYLNIKRGTVEGLNPLMFMFALAGNAAYVASILVRTHDRNKLSPNMPWLVDAVVCVLLDFLILGQFVLYNYCSRKDEHGDDVKTEDYVAVNSGKPQLHQKS